VRLTNRLYMKFALPLAQRGRFEQMRQRWDEYERLEARSLEQNREMHWDRVRAVVEHAYATTPFYRARLDSAGIKPADLHTIHDLTHIPQLTRQDILENRDELWSRNYKREELLEAFTGGTTDTPVPLLRDPACIGEKMAVQLRFNAWANYFPGDKTFYLWGARQDFAENPSWKWRMYERFLMRRTWAQTSVFNEEVLEKHWRTLNEFRPRVIYAYPSAAAIFCEYLRDQKKEVRHRPVSMIVTAEPLLPEQRAVITEVLGCPVYEHYGTRDFGLIAAECERQSGMHVHPSIAHVEFIPVEGAEVEGLHEILVTDLMNLGQPMIRYKINDCTVIGPEKCACGRGYPLMQKIVGRTTDVITLPNGDRVLGVVLPGRILQVCPAIKKIQIIQETLSDFRIRYVPGVDFNIAELDNLKAKLTKYLCPGLNWTFEAVDDIPREKSGKARFCISRVTTRAAQVGGRQGA